MVRYVLRVSGEERQVRHLMGVRRELRVMRYVLGVSGEVRWTPKFGQVAKPESTEGGRRVSVPRRQEGAPVLLG